MTKKTLSGRALDEACARAVGTWKDDPETAATQAEMLAWLEALAYTLDLSWTDGRKTFVVTMSWNEGTKSAHGSTIDEALARLVVAVAKERAK